MYATGVFSCHKSSRPARPLRRVQKIEHVKDERGAVHEHVTLQGKDGKSVVLEDEPGLAALNKAGKLKAGDEISQYRSEDGTNSIHNATEHATVRADKDGHTHVEGWDSKQQTPHQNGERRQAHPGPASPAVVATLDGYPKYANTPMILTGRATGVDIQTDKNGGEHVTMRYDDHGTNRVVKFESPMHAKDGTPVLDGAGKPVENPLVSMAHELKDNPVERFRVDVDGRGNPPDKGNIDYHIKNVDKSMTLSGHSGPNPPIDYDGVAQAKTSQMVGR